MKRVLEQTTYLWATFGLVAVSVIASLGEAGCSRPAVDTIRIAVAGPMTGDQSKQGTDLKNGIELAVTEWNEKGGVLGKKIELLVGDDQHDPKQAVAIGLSKARKHGGKMPAKKG